MKFKSPGEISVRGITFKPDESGIVDIEIGLAPAEIEQIEGVGAKVYTAEMAAEDASQKKEPQKLDEKTERLAIIGAAQDEFGVKLDGRKPVETLRALLQKLRDDKAEADAAAEKLAADKTDENAGVDVKPDEQTA